MAVACCCDSFPLIANCSQARESLWRVCSRSFIPSTVNGMHDSIALELGKIIADVINYPGDSAFEPTLAFLMKMDLFTVEARLRSVLIQHGVPSTHPYLSSNERRCEAIGSMLLKGAHERVQNPALTGRKD